MVVLDMSRCYTSILHSPILLQCSGQKVPYKLHSPIAVHPNINLHAGSNLFLPRPRECVNSCSHDLRCLYRINSANLLRISTTLTHIQTRFELTILSGITTILCHVMIVLVPLFIVFRERWIYILVCIAVILIISIFIIYDTQVIY